MCYVDSIHLIQDLLSLPEWLPRLHVLQTSVDQPRGVLPTLRLLRGPERQPSRNSSRLDEDGDKVIKSPATLERRQDGED